MKNAVRSLACAVVCLCSAATSAAIPAASGYVQNGLYNHWDGFENAGAGLAHDANATTWANLAPGASDRVWHINSHAEWKDFGLHFKGTGRVDGAGPSSMLSWSNGCCTVEFIYSNEKKDHTILFGLNYSGVLYAYTDSAWHVGFRGGSVAASYGVAVPSETYTYFTVVYTNAGTYVNRFYVNNVETANGGMNEYWGRTDRCLGGRDDGYSAQGDLLSIRIYKGDLSDEDRTANYNLDRARFGLYTDGRAISVTTLNGGSVAINTGTPASSAEERLVTGTTATVKAFDTDDEAFGYWIVTRLNEIAYASKERDYSFTVEKDTSCKAVFFKKTGRDHGDKRLANYVFDGMIGMWDAISNDGPASPHNTNPSTWSDCVGVCDLTVYPARSAWHEKSFECLGGGNAARGAVTRSGCQTIEIVMDPPPQGDRVVFAPGVNSRLIATGPSGANRLAGCHQGKTYPTGASPATFAFTYSGTSVANFYTNGIDQTSAALSEAVSWGMGSSAVCVSGRVQDDNSGYCSPATIYAIRLYNRVLTAEELAANAAVDTARFFRDEESSTLVNVRGSGTVSVNGGEAKASQEISLERDTPLNLVATPASGCRFVGWEPAGVDLPSGADYSTNDLTIAYTPALTRMTAVFAAEGTYSSGDYVHDDLGAMWDGLDNAGRGAAHDASAAVWKDLVGSRNLTLITGNAAFDAQSSLVCNPSEIISGCATEPTMPVVGARTYEVVCDVPTSGASCIFDTGNGAAIRSANGGVGCDPIGLVYKVASEQATLTFVKDETRGWIFFVNGRESTNHIDTAYLAVGTRLVLGGTSASVTANRYTGKIYAARVYTRSLTPQEVLKNADLDQRRYFGSSVSGDEAGVRTAQDGSVECLLRLTTMGEGEIVVNGSDAIRGTREIWVKQGASVSLVARPNGSRCFLGWVDDDRVALTNGQFAATAITFTMRRRTELGAAFVKTKVFRNPTAASYATNGITAWWDALENVGLGLPHAAETNRWYDLSGQGRHWALTGEGTNYRWDPTCLRMLGVACFGSFVSGAKNLTAEEEKTVECVVASYASTPSFIVNLHPSFFDPIISGNQSASRFLLWASTTRLCVNSDFAVTYTCGNTNALSAVLASLGPRMIHKDGDPASIVRSGDWWSTTENALGGRSGTDPRQANASLFAVRVYNRTLSPVERLTNEKLDRIRFLGEEPPKMKVGLLVIVK